MGNVSMTDWWQYLGLHIRSSALTPGDNIIMCRYSHKVYALSHDNVDGDRGREVAEAVVQDVKVRLEVGVRHLLLRLRTAKHDGLLLCAVLLDLDLPQPVLLVHAQSVSAHGGACWQRGRTMYSSSTRGSQLVHGRRFVKYARASARDAHASRRFMTSLDMTTSAPSRSSRCASHAGRVHSDGSTSTSASYATGGCGPGMVVRILPRAGRRASASVGARGNTERRSARGLTSSCPRASARSRGACVPRTRPSRRTA